MKKYAKCVINIKKMYIIVTNVKNVYAIRVLLIFLHVLVMNVNVCKKENLKYKIYYKYVNNITQ